MNNWSCPSLASHVTFRYSSCACILSCQVSLRPPKPSLFCIIPRFQIRLCRLLRSQHPNFISEILRSRHNTVSLRQECGRMTNRACIVGNIILVRKHTYLLTCLMYTACLLDYSKSSVNQRSLFNMTGETELTTLRKRIKDVLATVHLNQVIISMHWADYSTIGSMSVVVHISDQFDNWL